LCSRRVIDSSPVLRPRLPCGHQRRLRRWRHGTRDHEIAAPVGVAIAHRRDVGLLLRSWVALEVEVGLSEAVADRPRTDDRTAVALEHLVRVALDAGAGLTRRDVDLDLLRLLPSRHPILVARAVWGIGGAGGSRRDD